MENSKQNANKYDLEKRTLEFARGVRSFVGRLPRTISNIEDGKQLVRSSGSVGANYIEANEALSRKDCLMRIKISRKESKESCYWLELVNVGSNPDLEKEREELRQEAREFTRMFGSMVEKFKKSKEES